MAIIRVPVTITNTSLAGGPFMNIFHFSVENDIIQSNLGEALDALQTFYTAVQSLYPSNTTIRFGEGMVSDPLGNPEFVPDDPHQVTPPASDAVASTMLAIVVGWRSSSATRRGRGRTFLGPVRKAMADVDGTPTASTMTTVRNAASAFVADSSTANGWELGVLSVTDGQFRQAIGTVTHDRWGVLRSRRD